MCGIYGFCGIQTKKTCKIIKRLGINNISRGRDSTGIALISKDKLELHKNTQDSIDFFRNPSVLQTISNFRRDDHTIAIGHTRFATHGAVTLENAHPFQISNVVFAHNGIIYNFKELQEKYGTNFEVDSQIIGYLIATEGPKQAFEQLMGSFTVPFFMVDDPKVLHVATSNQDFAFAIRDRQLYYSSDMMDLQDSLRGQKGFTFCAGGNDVIYTFFDNGSKIEVVKESFKGKRYYTAYQSDSYYREFNTVVGESCDTNDFNDRFNTTKTVIENHQLQLLKDIDKTCNEFECEEKHIHKYILEDDEYQLVVNPEWLQWKAGQYQDDFEECNKLQCLKEHVHRFIFAKQSDSTFKLIPNPDYKPQIMLEADYAN